MTALGSMPTFLKKTSMHSMRGFTMATLPAKKCGKLPFCRHQDVLVMIDKQIMLLSANGTVHGRVMDIPFVSVVALDPAVKGADPTATHAAAARHADDIRDNANPTLGREFDTSSSGGDHLDPVTELRKHAAGRHQGGADTSERDSHPRETASHEGTGAESRVLVLTSKGEVAVLRIRSPESLQASSSCEATQSSDTPSSAGDLWLEVEGVVQLSSVNENWQRRRGSDATWATDDA